MSLLLEALRKAEEAKRRGEEAGTEPEKSAEPSPSAPPPPRITPAHELELIDDEFAQAARFAGLDVPEPTPSPPAAVTSGSEAARLLFDAKQPPKGRSGVNWTLAGGGALMLLAVGAWVLWQVSALERSGNSMPVQGTVSPPSAVVTGSAAPMTRSGADAAPAVPAAPASMPTPAATDAPAGADTRPPRNTDSGHVLSGQLAPAAAQPEPALSTATAAPRIHITRNPPSVPQDVADGYAAFQAGEFDRARVAYERALRSDPRNPDALHGLAALAQRDNDETRVRQIMRRIGEVDPTDTAAQVALADNADPAIQEARLLDIVAARPRSADAAMALGTLYASQSRWREAQQAWFNAYTLAPDQPDHAYNLAVSLDHMRQPRLALQYYREALALSASRPASFDGGWVTRRIASLQAPDGF